MFTTFVTVGILIGILGIILLYANRTAFMRLWGAGSAQVGKLGRMAIEADPIAVLQNNKDRAIESMREAIAAQSDFRGHIESVKRQVVDGKLQESRLDAKVRSALNVKDEDKAESLVSSLQREKDQLFVNEKQLTALQTSYDNNMKKIKAAQSTIASIDEEARRLKVELKFSKAEKDLGELLSKVQVGIDMGSVNEAKEEARRQIDRNRGAAAVRAELDLGVMTEYEEAELERQDRAKQLLEEYKKTM